MALLLPVVAFLLTVVIVGMLGLRLANAQAGVVDRRLRDVMIERITQSAAGSAIRTHPVNRP